MVPVDRELAGELAGEVVNGEVVEELGKGVGVDVILLMVPKAEGGVSNSGNDCTGYGFG